MTDLSVTAHRPEAIGDDVFSDIQFVHTNDKEAGQYALSVILRICQETQLFASYGYLSNPIHIDNNNRHGIETWHRHPPPVFVDDFARGAPDDNDTLRSDYYTDLNAGSDEITWARRYYNVPCLTIPDDTLAFPRQIAQLMPPSDAEGIARRLRQLRELSLNDPEEPTIAEGSLSTIIGFFYRYGPPLAVLPDLSLSPKGHVVAEWYTGSRDRRMVAVEFLPESILRYVVLRGDDSDDPTIMGTSSASDAASILLPFLTV